MHLCVHLTLVNGAVVWAICRARCWCPETATGQGRQHSQWQAVGVRGTQARRRGCLARRDVPVGLHRKGLGRLVLRAVWELLGPNCGFLQDQGGAVPTADTRDLRGRLEGPELGSQYWIPTRLTPRERARRPAPEPRAAVGPGPPWPLPFSVPSGQPRGGQSPAASLESRTHLGGQGTSRPRGRIGGPCSREHLFLRYVTEDPQLPLISEDLCGAIRGS